MVLFFLLANVLAQSPVVETKIVKSKTEQCIENSGGVTAKMLDCANDEFKEYDTELNVTYKKLLKEKSKFQQNALKKAQQAWIRFRDAECHYYADPDAGTSAALDLKSCVIDLTKKRVLDLKKL